MPPETKDDDTRKLPDGDIRKEQIFTALKNLNPLPTTELNYVNPYTCLIAVMLSAQSTDKGVNLVTAPLFAIADTPERMVDLGVKKVEAMIASLGLFRNKSKNVIACSNQLIANHNSKVPETRQELEALPGVGRKTANVILNTIYSQPTIAVDTHVFRVSHRLGLSTGSTPLAVEKDLDHGVPKRFKLNAHHWLILLGRYICVARKPKCQECPVSDYCPSREVINGGA